MSSIFSGSAVRKVFMLLLVLMCGLVFIAPAQAEEAQAEDDFIGGLLEMGVWFTPFHRTSAFRGLQREIDDQTGIFVELGATTTWQIASDVEMGDDNVLNTSYDLAGEWALLDADFGKGILKFGIDGGFNIGSKKSEELSANIGSNLGINEDWDTEEINVGSIYWLQTLFDDRLAIVVGRSSGDTFIDDNRVAADETSQFLASPFTGNPTIAGPGKGGTLAASWTINDTWYFSAGISDSMANSRTSGFDTIDDGRWFTSSEVGYAANLGDLSGIYRFYGWYTDVEVDDGGGGVTGAHGSGFGMSLDQDLPGVDGLIGFFRAGWADGGSDIGDLETFFSGGVAIEGPLGRENDMVGLGVAWGKPTDDSVNDETVIEAFYRYQINKYMEISPDVQYVLNPGDSSSTLDNVLVFGLRLQITYGGPES